MEVYYYWTVVIGEKKCKITRGGTMRTLEKSQAMAFVRGLLVYSACLGVGGFYIGGV